MAAFLLKTALALATLAGMAYLGYGLRTAVGTGREKDTGAELAVMCLKCGHVGVARVKQIHGCFCAKCGFPVGEAWRCLECGRTFPFVHRLPRDRAAGKKALEDWSFAHRCPHCNSQRTEPVATGNEAESEQRPTDLPRPERPAVPPLPAKPGP